MHTGIIVNELEPAMRFYTGILGFEDIWRGSRDGKVLNWVNVKPAETTDYVEFMLHDPVPEPTKRGSAHHICLVVPDLDKAAAILKERAAKDRLRQADGDPYRRQSEAAVESVRPGRHPNRIDGAAHDRRKAHAISHGSAAVSSWHKRIGCRFQYVSDRHAHSSGPKRK